MLVDYVRDAVLCRKQCGAVDSRFIPAVDFLRLRHSTHGDDLCVLEVDG